MSLHTQQDHRGTLALLDNPIYTKYSRLFVVQNGTKNESIRGNHAHRISNQFLVCLSGKIQVELFDGTTTLNEQLSQFGDAIRVPPLVWTRQTYSKDAVLLVLSDTEYSESEYINSMEEFLKLVHK